MLNSSLPDWEAAFRDVCSGSTCQLEWGLPEPWVQAELYSVLRQSAERSGWEPFATELPYITYYPVMLPKPGTRDWKSVGAVKWIDLCLHNKSANAWCWFELKVRQASTGSRDAAGTRAALDAAVKDYVGLCGFDVRETSSVWARPDQATQAYWIAETLGPYADELVGADHYIVSAYLQLNGEFNSAVISEPGIRARLSSWLAHRSNGSSHQRQLPATVITFASTLPRDHALFICASRVPSGVDR